MSLMTKTKTVSTNPLAVTEPITAQNAPIPQVWDGLQFHFSADYGFIEGQFDPSYSNPNYRNNFYSLISDAAGREFQKDSFGNKYNGLFRMNPSGGPGGWSELSTGTFLGKNEIVAATKGRVHYLSGEAWQDPSDKIRQNTLAYTMFILFRADAGSVGGIISQSNSVVASNDAAGFRVGFGSGSDVGKFIVQHKIGQRVVIDRNIADGTPALVAITCSEDQAVTVRIRHAGAYTVHTRQLTEGFDKSNSLVIGSCDDVGAGVKRWAVFTKFSRQLTDAETDFVFEQIQKSYPGLN